MGAQPWEYFVPYEQDIQAALDKLRARVFSSGQFRGHELKPDSIESALRMMKDQGTASILDIQHIAETPDFMAATPINPDALMDLFGTDRPSHTMIESNMDLFEDIERGQAVYLIVYKDDEPSEIFFGGYSFD